jgi:hypothetical protein
VLVHARVRYRFERGMIAAFAAGLASALVTKEYCGE